jgi:hypothetical protein
MRYRGLRAAEVVEQCRKKLKAAIFEIEQSQVHGVDADQFQFW